MNIAHLLLQHGRENNPGTVLDTPMDVKLPETDVVREEREKIVQEDFVDAWSSKSSPRDRETVALS